MHPKYLYLFIVLLCCSRQLTANSKLPLLQTKQQINSLRFISENGNFIYYQRHDGKLMLSTNYSVKEVLSGKKYSNYLIFSSASRKKILISQDENYHYNYQLRGEHNLFVADFGKSETVFIGKGLSPQLHLNDQWVSFWMATDKLLIFVNLDNPLMRFELSFSEVTHPYFFPQVAMLNDNFILYTNIDKKNLAQLVNYNRSSQKSTILYQANHQLTRLQICKNNSHLFLFALQEGRSPHSEIFKFTIDLQQSLTQPVSIYQSQQIDVGNILCQLDQDRIFFIKNFSPDSSQMLNEVVSYNLRDQQISTLSDLKHVTQLLDLDGRLIIPLSGQYYLAWGEDLSFKDNFFDKQEENKK